MLGFLIWVCPILIFILFAFRQRSQAGVELDSSQQAVEIHKERLAALKARHDAGEIDDEEYQSFRLEEEKALLADTEVVSRQTNQSLTLSWVWVLVATVIMMAAAWVAYDHLGARDAVAVREEFRALSMNADLKPEEIEAALDSYEALLQSEPDNIEGWFRLSRMQMDMQRHESAIRSLQHVLEQLRLVEHNADDEAAVLRYLGQSQATIGQTEAALASYESSLEYGISNNALGMAGRLSYDLGLYQKAIDYWTRLTLNSPQIDVSIIDDFIDDAKNRLAEQGIDYEAEQPARIIVQVELPAAWEGLSDQAALFVYARPVGQRMPLAVKRLRVNAGQMAVILSDADAMGPMGGISEQDEVEVTARISLTGLANTQPGDWTGTAEIVDMSESSPQVTIQVQQP
ncbi:c-type cytochrome biogenesis protein CcmI [Reinekea blandensis]|uniref:Cytochrome c biogenesis factor n=1 Tax=Reinekea blandensis MED297 TaxID=314283 RepID=A4BHE6_9GAMM|nr:c-type cytochrome biogenesis protein CcmI [Reinekea blandensis]EAR08494.1 Cytochrome c biogenesis factor [Reinekea sp. MED297] [Reinekea blandensis MED297]